MTYKIEIVPRSEREVLIAKRLESSTEKGEPIYDFRGDVYTPSVISIPIDVPIYRLENCRTFSAQQSEIATHGHPADHFSKGQEKSSVQAEQHEILKVLAKRGTGSVTPIIDVLRKDGQRETILISSTGVVVNGNRRLCAMRELYRGSDGSVDERFSYVKCSVLPPDTSADEIDDIEADLQARPQTKLDYDWIGDAQLIRRQVNKGRTPKQVADRLRRSKNEIENVLQALDEADLYLSEWAGKPGHYELLSADGEQIFADIPKQIARKSTALQNASRAIAWSLFENRESIEGRVYRLNAAFGKLAPQVLEAMAEELDLSTNNSISDEDTDDDFALEIDSDESNADYQPVIDALKNEETKDDAVQVLIEASESAIERDKGLKSEKAALKALSQANAKILGIDVNMAGKGTLPAMKKQVESIRNALKKIEDRIEARLDGLSESGKTGGKGAS